MNYYKISSLVSKFFLLFLTFTFFWRGIIYLDPDFGWHLQAGEMILHSGFPQNDPFSYTMVDERMPTWIQISLNGQQFWAYHEFNDILEGSRFKLHIARISSYYNFMV
jgi:hypothetical protein